MNSVEISRMSESFHKRGTPFQLLFRKKTFISEYSNLGKKFCYLNWGLILLQQLVLTKHSLHKYAIP